ncbi:MAG TPA: hypothetical protein VIS07_12550 [Candidatus Binatia bacterium]
MFFIHCDHCDETLRAGTIDGRDPALERDEDLEAFHQAHAGCPLRFFQPTGRGTASGPWHEPMVERWLEVRDRDGLAVAIGSRTSIEEPLRWRIERIPFEEELDVGLDEPLFRDIVTRAVRPHVLSERQLAAWTLHIANFARSLAPEDVVVLFDDVAEPDRSAACMTLTARVPLEASLRAFRFEVPIEERLRGLFDDPEFPPLRVTRRPARRRVATTHLQDAAVRLDSPDPLV